MKKRTTSICFAIVVMLRVSQRVSSFAPCYKRCPLIVTRKTAVTTADDIAVALGPPSIGIPAQGTTTKIQTKTKPQEGAEKFLIHRGRSAAMIKRSPSIGGIGLFKGWTPQATEHFIAAVETIGEKKAAGWMIRLVTNVCGI
jgi:hypothetical protein